jgi:hypothetical protein
VLALILGTLLAVGALAYVLFPLFVGNTVAPVRRTVSAREGAASIEKEAVVALREIEFDRVTGKLSDNDYDELKARYTERALAAMRVGASGAGDDPVEDAVLAYRARLRSCVRCGPRPELDAAYCSNCGHYLPGECGSCGASVEEAGAAFCASCGQQLAA